MPYGNRIIFVSEVPIVVFVRWKHDKNGKETKDETERKSGRVHRKGKKWKGNIRQGSREGKTGTILLEVDFGGEVWGTIFSAKMSVIIFSSSDYILESDRSKYWCRALLCSIYFCE